MENPFMKMKLDWRKGAQENAAAQYSLSKELAKKEEGAKKAIEETLRLIEGAGSAVRNEGEKAKAAPKMKRKREWHEKFKWFFTSGGKLVVAGRDAKQNDYLVAKVMHDDDLFFHADIQGAPATILVGGGKASGQEKNEAAQFAASHSSAWKVGAAAVDVYAVRKEQLSKHAHGGFIGSGGFAIDGEREWFRSTKLELAAGADEGVFTCIPAVHPKAASFKFMVEMGRDEKGKAARFLARELSVAQDDVLSNLPSGCLSIKKRS